MSQPVFNFFKTNNKVFQDQFCYFDFFFLALAIFIIIALLFIIAFFLAPQNLDADKLAPYECGFLPFSDARLNFVIHYYVVGLLFILFDIELIFLLPWVVSLRIIDLTGFVVMWIFLLLLTAGLFLEWAANALNWRQL